MYTYKMSSKIISLVKFFYQFIKYMIFVIDDLKYRTSMYVYV